MPEEIDVSQKMQGGAENKLAKQKVKIENRVAVHGGEKFQILMSPSSPPETILSSLNERHVTAPRCPTSVAMHLPSSRTQTCPFNLPSAPPPKAKNRTPYTP